MVFKSYLVEKNISALDGYYAVLFYGENIGLKDDFKKLLKDKNKKSDIISFHENDIIKNKNLIDEQLMNNSLFNDKKIIIINDVSEKLKNEIIKITQEIQENIKIFLFSGNLEKKSLIRTHFEKEKNLATVPCYLDNERTLSFYLRANLKDFQGLNQDLINTLIKNSGSDRKMLSQEIEKIRGLFLSKKIDEKKVINLINNAYNIDFDNLRDNCLGADKENLNKNLGNISLQNEKSYFYLNNLNIRIEKLLNLNNMLVEKKNLDEAIDSINPKIFWKDKPTFKKQLKIWNLEKLKRARKIVFETEIIIKTKFGSLSNILIKMLLIELCSLANSS